ncbi:MAG: beta-ketoacyl-[acyl-carrier-protein] synthase family protein [Opitutaceae bacterium]|nr:beta-ketoacyl-[acyl-carrier-protein] synthase family protein [Opitutaceae bacterium]MBP9913610.1 beta-ketoacyl-[acyl-carrier-protein] synthase family protein [Opitutaceae bacterium]
MPRHAVITGLGFITCIGNDQATVQKNLREGQHGLECVEFLGNPDLSVKVVGTIKEFTAATPHWRDWRYPARYELPREALRGLSPHGLYALCAVEQALADARLGAPEITDGATGLYCASAGSTLLAHYHVSRLLEARGERCHPLSVISSIAGTLNFNLAAHYGIRGAVGGFVAACASSSHALGCALDDIRLGRQQRMIVVGAEEATAESILPFSAMGALSTNPDPSTASRPFDAARDGFVGSGGAVALIIEEAEYARARGAPIYAEFAGWGQAADGYNIAISHPEGTGLVDAIRRALTDTGLPPAGINYINAHATSTHAGDRSEAIALQKVFSEAGAYPRISSTKGLTGHPLSMAGVMEAAFCALAIKHGFMPGNAHLCNPDPICTGLDLPRHTLNEAPRTVLSTSSGFGGSNVALIFKQA